MSTHNLKASFEELMSDSDFMPYFEEAKQKYESRKQKKKVHKAATSFGFEDAITAFKLSYCYDLKTQSHLWKIEKEKGFKEFGVSPCLLSHLSNYTDIYDRSSEAACRVGFDLIISECIASYNGMEIQLEYLADSEKPEKRPKSKSNSSRPSTPPPPRQHVNLKVYCEIPFKHEFVNHHEIIDVGGRVDLGVAIHLQPAATGGLIKDRFYSLLFSMEAKTKGNIDSALPQLIVYLASLRQSRIKRKRRDSSVYGVATDGISYMFVTITNDGVLRMTKRYDLGNGRDDLASIISCLRFILDKAISMSPNASPTQPGATPSQAENMDDTNDSADDDEVINPLAIAYRKGGTDDNEDQHHDVELVAGQLETTVESVTSQLEVAVESVATPIDTIKCDNCIDKKINCITNRGKQSCKGCSKAKKACRFQGNRRKDVPKLPTMPRTSSRSHGPTGSRHGSSRKLLLKPSQDSPKPLTTFDNAHSKKIEYKDSPSQAEAGPSSSLRRQLEGHTSIHDVPRSPSINSDQALYRPQMSVETSDVEVVTGKGKGRA